MKPMNATPLVSVNMPVYNGAAFIGEAIRSILQQTYRNFELIVVNDGSTDATGQIINRINDPRIRHIDRAENKGLAFSRNEALLHSTGKYVAILDSDDIALPNRLSEQVAFLEVHPDYAMVGSWVQPINADGTRAGQVWQYAIAHAQIAAGLLLHNQFAQPSVMLRRKMVPEEGYHHAFPPAEDYELWTRIARKAKVANLPEPLTLYRLHGGNISTVKDTVIKEKDSIIRANQLKFLLMDFTLRDAHMYEAMIAKGGKDVYNKQEVLQLLDRMLKANQTKGIYEQNTLAVTLSRYWQNVLIEGPQYNMVLLMLYLKSSFRATQDLTFRQQAAIVFKCLTNWKK